MTSQDRRNARYKRRRAKRDAKHREFLSRYDDFYLVMNRDALAKAAYAASKEVSWKSSVKRFLIYLTVNVARMNDRLMQQKDFRKGFICFAVNERGKRRDIMSIHFSERVVQKSLCKNVLNPVLTHNLIYDNGASQKNKGTRFAVDRLQTHLHRYYRQHGAEGYILLIDFKGYYANIQHHPIKMRLRKLFEDERILWSTDLCIDAYYEWNLKQGIREHKGLGLGSEANQIFAVSYPNSIDHYVKEVLRIKGCGSYNDDRYLIHESKEYLQYCLQEIRKLCVPLGLIINEKKTQIVKLTHGFTFLKEQFILTETGHIIKKPCHAAIVRERRKLKRQSRLLDAGKMQFKDIRCSYESWKGCVSRKGARRTIHNMNNLYNKLLIKNWREKAYG